LPKEIARAVLAFAYVLAAETYDHALGECHQGELYCWICPRDCGKARCKVWSLRYQWYWNLRHLPKRVRL